MSLVGTLKPELAGYMKQVGELSRRIAEEYDLSKEELDQIEMAGMIHDIGLLGLPDDILSTDESQMSKDEFRMYSQHPMLASICLESIEKLGAVGEIVLYHHERFDGRGFPSGLKGYEIPLGARIIGVAAEYLRIVRMWPHNIQSIKERAARYLGAVVDDITASDIDKMLEKIAQKIILDQAHQKYDINVVSNLIKKLKVSPEHAGDGGKKAGKVLFVLLDDLKEGMELVHDLRLHDSRLLLVKGSVLKASSIKSIQDLGKKKLLGEHVYVAA